MYLWSYHKWLTWLTDKKREMNLLSHIMWEWNHRKSNGQFIQGMPWLYAFTPLSIWDRHGIVIFLQLHCKRMQMKQNNITTMRKLRKRWCKYGGIVKWNSFNKQIMALIYFRTFNKNKLEQIWSNKTWKVVCYFTPLQHILYILKSVFKEFRIRFVSTAMICNDAIQSIFVCLSKWKTIC